MANHVASSRRAAVDTFLERNRQLVACNGRARLIFALDATASRQPSWDHACHLQAEMFQEAAAIGGLEIQLVYYRGPRECSASRWISDARTLANLMSRIDCRAGYTQIGKVLAHARTENARQKVQTVVFVGDAMEETPADIYDAASRLGVPVFLFQEFDDSQATQTFLEIARITGGAHFQFDRSSARQLAELLRAVAVYAAGGLKALSESANAGAVKLLERLK